MLNQIKIIEYAIKGINKDIEDLDKTVRKGYKMIESYHKGETLKTKISIYDIEKICKEKSSEIEKLEKMKNELKWKLSELEEK